MHADKISDNDGVVKDSRAVCIAGSVHLFQSNDVITWWLIQIDRLQPALLFFSKVGMKALSSLPWTWSTLNKAVTIVQ